jgi:high affinity Mn2+ porin
MQSETVRPGRGALAGTGFLYAAVLVFVGWGSARATDWFPPYVVGGQSTVVWQHLPSFNSPYIGPRSLRPGPEDAVSHSYTLYTGLRLARWLDVYVDPEMIRGNGIGGGFGLAGYTNGEVIRNPQAGQSPYLARAFLRATIPLGGSSQDTEPGLLAVGGHQPTRRLVLTGGILSTADIFDTNRYANSTRTQFLNWSFINNTAWDFAADTRGYTRGAAAEWIEESWAVRLGAFQMFTNGVRHEGRWDADSLFAVLTATARAPAHA